MRRTLISTTGRQYNLTITTNSPFNLSVLEPNDIGMPAALQQMHCVTEC